MKSGGSSKPKGYIRTDPSAEVSTLETEIDNHVYNLYGLTKDEIKIVEKAHR